MNNSCTSTLNHFKQRYTQHNSIRDLLSAVSQQETQKHRLSARSHVVKVVKVTNVIFTKLQIDKQEGEALQVRI